MLKVCRLANGCLVQISGAACRLRVLAGSFLLMVIVRVDALFIKLSVIGIFAASLASSVTIAVIATSRLNRFVATLAAAAPGQETEQIAVVHLRRRTVMAPMLLKR